MPVRVLLIEPKIEGNIGAVARSMKNFGLSELWIVDSREHISNEEKGFASHAQDVLGGCKRVKSIQKCDIQITHFAA